jgi:hypothetical protein
MLTRTVLTHGLVAALSMAVAVLVMQLFLDSIHTATITIVSSSNLVSSKCSQSQLQRQSVEHIDSDGLTFTRVVDPPPNRPEVIVINYYGTRKGISSKTSAPQKLGLDTAAEFGATATHAWTAAEVDDAFRARNQHIFNNGRGAGCWLWKPYIIWRTLLHVNWGDIVVYLDAGAYVASSLEPLVQLAEKHDIVTFELGYAERKYTKRDTFVAMDADSAEFTDTRQRHASFSVWKKTNRSLDFVAQWLSYAQDIRLLCDGKSTLGSEYPEFKDHRHDQSIASILGKKWKLPTFPSPTGVATDNFEPPESWQQYGFDQPIITHTRQYHRIVADSHPAWCAKPLNRALCDFTKPRTRPRKYPDVGGVD